MLPQIDLTQLTVAPTIHWIEDFGAWLHEQGRSVNTISAYLQDLRHFRNFFQRENDEAFAPSFLNAMDVKKYFARMDADKDVAVNSRNRRLASLRVMVGWAVEIGVLEYDPTVCIKRVAVEPSPRDRTRDEMSRLDAVVNDGLHLRCASAGHAWLGLRDRMLWILFKEAGLRISEIAASDVGDIDFEAGKIYVMGKGAKKAEVKVGSHLLDEARAWLNARRVNSSALITDQDGERITRGQIWRRIKMIGGAAGIGNLKPHDLRHTFAYTVADAFMAQGLSEFAIKNGVRKQLRHADEKTTGIYFGIRDSQIRAAMEVV